MAFQAELLYADLGYRYKWDGNIKTSTGNFSSTRSEQLDAGQISLPLSLKYYPNNAFNVSFGVNLGYFVNGNYKDSYTYAPASGFSKSSSEEDIYDEDKWGNKVFRFYAGHFVGAEYNFPGGFFIDARYNYGLTDMKYWRDYESDTYNDTEKINYIQLGVGYKFGGNGTAPKASKKYQ